MAKQPPIRIMERDKREYARLVKNTKSKIRRVQKKYGLDLSDKIDIPSLSDFENRKQFNQFKQDQSVFTNRANQHYQFQKNRYGVVANKKEINELKSLTQQAQENANKLIERIEKLPYYRGGEQIDTVKELGKRMAKPNVGGIYPVPDFNFEKYKSRGAFLRDFDRVEQRADPGHYDRRTKVMRDNFIDDLEKAFNDDADELVKGIKAMSLDDFYDMYLSNEEFNFDDFGSEGNEVTYLGNSKANAVLEMEGAFDHYINGRSEYKDLKIF